MKHSLQSALVTGLAVLLIGAPASSHHSFAAEFDSAKPVTLTGTVTKIEWQNPHAYLYMDVVDEATGEANNWQIELGSPNGLRRLGWRQTTVKEGDELRVEGTLARVRPNLANARSAVLVETGQRLGASSSEGQR